MRKILVILVFVVMIMLVGCTKKVDPYADLSFKKICAQTGGMWMKMQPTQNYIPTGQQACEGCMQSGGDHICEKEKYIQTLEGEKK